MGEDDFTTWYQCKLCQDHFKTTAELQKHKRVNHRNPPPAEAKKERVLENENGRSSCNGGSTESKVTGTSGKGGRSGSGSQLHCKSCDHKFDTRDPVVFHLLSQNKNENGAFKCPYCVKVQLRESDVLEEEKPQVGGRSPRSPMRNLSMRRRSRSSGSSVDRSRLPNLRRVTNGVQKKKIPLTESRPTTPKSSFKSRTSSSAVTMPPSVFKNDAAAESSSSSAGSHRTYELIYRKPKGKGSRGGRVSSGGSRRGSNLETIAQTPPPLKVSVILNNSPFPSETRLAVPKSKDYEKGNIACQYCGFVAKSFREVQFHVNTHMAKAYPCEFCPAIYRSKQAVVKHTAKHHGDQVNGNRSTSEVRSDLSYHNNSNLMMEDGEDQSNFSSSVASDSIGGEDSNSCLDSTRMNDNSLSFSTYPAPTSDSSHQFQNKGPYNGASFGGLDFNQGYFSASNTSFVNRNSELCVYPPPLAFQQPQPELLPVNGCLEKVVELANF